MSIAQDVLREYDINALKAIVSATGQALHSLPARGEGASTFKYGFRRGIEVNADKNEGTISIEESGNHGSAMIDFRGLVEKIVDRIPQAGHEKTALVDSVYKPDRATQIAYNKVQTSRIAQTYSSDDQVHTTHIRLGGHDNKAAIARFHDAAEAALRELNQEHQTTLSYIAQGGLQHGR